VALVVDELVERAHAGLHRGRGGRASDHGDVLIGSWQPTSSTVGPATT
jgi:hypothetical protein